MSATENGSPSPNHAARLAACRAAMAADGIEHFLITQPHDAFYLTGFSGEDSAVLIAPSRIHVITDARFRQAAERETPWARRWIRKMWLSDEIANACKRLRLECVWVQPEHVTLAFWRELLTKCRPTKFKKAPPIIGKLRRRKDDLELRILQQSIDVAQNAFLSVKRHIRPGRTEQELAARLEYEMKRRGASEPAFKCICAEGPNASSPHAATTDRVIRRGSAVLFDWGARYGHYCSDLTRVVFVGSIPAEIGRMYRVALEAQARAIAAIRPGRRMCDVDQVARGHIDRSGYKKKFAHGLGHGLGLDVHEAPALSWRSKEEMEAGMVVTVEPGIYLPGVGGVRVEDDVLITPDGGQLLTSLPRNIEAMVV